MNSNNYIKLLIGVLLFATWVLLVVFKVPGTEDIIGTIKLALAGLGVYHIKDVATAAPAAVDRQGGFAAPGLLLALAIGAAMLLTGCAVAPTPAQPVPQAMQVAYTQACASYGAAFAGALQLREAGRLTRAQINQVTLIDNQVTPICTGPLPTDPVAATEQVTAAVTTLTILELAQKGN